ncbi:MAG: type II toxin-antitoxin system Phd/YefM family antitoxin [Pseudomonadota bacterium]
MLNLKKINPVTDFVRNYKAFLGRIKESGQPEVLTINGKPEYVIIDANSYGEISEEIERRRFVKAVNEGIEDFKNGKGADLKSAFAGIRTQIDL